jgi:sialate O-acetylesterase
MRTPLVSAIRRITSTFAVFTLLVLSLPLIGWSKVIMPAVFTDHMVLQQNSRIKIWGWADPWESAVISLSWTDQTFKIKGNANASWHIFADTPAKGGPHTITITTKEETVQIKDILFGEVWLLTGQSNMEWSAKRGVKDALEELPKSFNNQMRLFKMSKRGAAQPQMDAHGQWAVCDSASLYNFSAVGYFFGKNLQQQLDTPIGLIDLAWGGSYIESWIPQQLVELYDLTKESTRKIPPSDHWPLNAGSIYNGMVSPIMDYPFAGVLWYQGESNAHFPRAYYQLKHMMVENWRRVRNQNFPFYYVQIAPFDNRGDSTGIAGARVREAQTQAMDIPNSGMVVITDQVDNIRDVHPAYKKQVGLRLSHWALAEHYREKTPAYRSPQYLKQERKGNRLFITFQHVSDGLIAREGNLREFQIAGADRRFVTAQAKIIGKDQIEVWSDEINNPTAVRFAFRNAPEPNLFDRANLPVTPFRTDDW